MIEVGNIITSRQKIKLIKIIKRHLSLILNYIAGIDGGFLLLSLVTGEDGALVTPSSLFVPFEPHPIIPTKINPIKI